MKAKQRDSRGSASQMSLFSLQKNLLQVWQNLNVDEYYQNLILSYVDSLPGHQAQSLIAKEIKATHEGSSQYFKLAERLRNRKKELSQLSNLIKGESRSAVDAETLSGASELLNQLRDHNLVVAEMLINLHRQYNRGEQNSVSDECMQMLLNLDSDNSFLKDSFLSQFILFQQGYDPFFLYHYDMKGKKIPPVPHPIIDQLFNLNISYACRLFKAKTRVLEILSSGKYNETKLFKRKSKNYQSSSPKRLFTETPTPSEELRTIDREEDTKRETGSGFKVRKVLSLQKAKEKERLRSIDRDSSHFQKQRPIINQGKLHTLGQETPNESENEGEDYKLAPMKYKKNLPRSHYFQQPKKRQDMGENPMKYFLNFKEKLQPIPNRHDNEDQEQEESKNRSSIFKRSTLREALLRPKESSKTSMEESPAERKRLKTPVDTQLKSSGGKEIKMRPGKLTIQQLPQYLKSLTLPQQLKNQTIFNEKYEQSLSRCQSYLSEFLINGEMKAVGLVFALPDEDYLIKLWGPLRSCDEQASKMLLGKFLDYIQKQTSCNNIYYSGTLKPLFLSLSFLPKNDKLLFRKRLSPLPTKQLQFPQFLSLRCSNLLFPQENRSVNMLYSEEIEPFTDRNHHVDRAFAEIDRAGLSKTLELSAKISEEISDMKALNSLLEDEQFDTYEVTSSMKISSISAIRLAAHLHFRSAFIAGEGLFKFNGEEVARKGESLVCRVQCAQANYSLLFGKGLPSIPVLLELARKSQKRTCEFAVKMFSKQLYGRMGSRSSDRSSYGNWQASLSWKDELQGRVRHPISSLQSFGPEPFFFCVELQSQPLFVLEVGSDDFLF